jgi:hypothetical protein
VPVDPYLLHLLFRKICRYYSALLFTFGFKPIYYIRVITEERHLYVDTTYIDYANAMNKRGMLSGPYKILLLKINDENMYTQDDGKIKRLIFNDALL